MFQCLGFHVIGLASQYSKASVVQGLDGTLTMAAIKLHLDWFVQVQLPRVFLAQASNALPPLGPTGNKQLSRRAAYNSLVRLKNNSNRLLQAPAALRDRLLQSSDVEVPRDLIELLHTKGSLDDLVAHFKVEAEQERFVKNTEEMIPMTQLQIEQIYGLEAKTVMRNKAVDVTCYLYSSNMFLPPCVTTCIAKEKFLLWFHAQVDQGLTEQDKNNPNGVVYLMFKDKREVGNVGRESTQSAFLM